MNYILLLNYKSSEDTINSLARLQELDSEYFTICVIDNFSNDESIDQITKFLNSSQQEFSTYINCFDPNNAGFINVISSTKNLGYGGGNNIVLKEIAKKADCNALIINPDIIVENPVIVEASKKLCQMKDQKLALGIKAINAWNNKELFLGGHKINFFSGTVSPITTSNQQADFISGSFLYTNSLTLREVGILPEDYFMYWEDADWCYQLKQSGGKIVTISELSFFDTQEPTRSSFAQYYYVKNMLKFLKKYQPIYLLTAIPLIPVRIGLRIMRGQFSYAGVQTKALLDFVFCK